MTPEWGSTDGDRRLRTTSKRPLIRSLAHEGREVSRPPDVHQSAR
jgi:hypothetical protein